MELLGGFAVLISLGGFIISAVVVIVFFVMAFNVSGIAQKVRNAHYRQDELKDKLDRIIYLMEQEARGRSNGRTTA